MNYIWFILKNLQNTHEPESRSPWNLNYFRAYTTAIKMAVVTFFQFIFVFLLKKII